MVIFRCISSALMTAWCIVAQTAPAPPSSELLRNADGTNDTFSAVGKLRASLTCTGTLIDPSGSGASDARAWLLTAGHCISLEPYGVIRNQPLTGQVQFNYFADTTDRLVTIRLRTTGWSTMKGTDIALLELDATLGDLLARGIRPLRLASTPAVAGQPVFWTGIPLSPIPLEVQFLRRGNCTLGEHVQLLERTWIWTDELSNDCPDLYEGASGSPLFDSASHDIIGVIGTGNLMNFEEGPEYDCQANRPCVLQTGGPVMQKYTSYASPVLGIGRCFDRSNNLDVRRTGCPLDPGVQLTISSVNTEVKPLVNGQQATWDAALSGNQRYYAYKTFAVGEGDCGSASGYSEPVALASAPVIRDTIGGSDGYYLLCVVAGDTPVPDDSWQQAVHASIRFKRLDSQPPAVPVGYKIEVNQNGYLLQNTTGGEGPSGFGLILSKVGPAAGTDCSEPQGYAISIWPPPLLRPSEFPTRVCWKISDKAGNFMNPVAFEFGPPTILPSALRNGASLERAAISPGSVFRVDTFNLTNTIEYSSTPVSTLAGVRMSLLDGSGTRVPVPLTMAGPMYLEAVLPDSTAPGISTLVLQPPDGPSIYQQVAILQTAPGLYTDLSGGAPSGYASDPAGTITTFSNCLPARGCTVNILPVASTAGGLDLVLYGTGLRNLTDHPRVRIGTHTVDAISMTPHPSIAGVDEVRFRLAQDFPLHLYQAISVETDDAHSNYLWIRLE